MNTENTKNPEKLQPSRTETFLLLLITGLYLVFEVAFGARLLDVVGATTDIHDIEQIEKSGRVISGIAIMILLGHSLCFLTFESCMQINTPACLVKDCLHFFLLLASHSL